MAYPSRVPPGLAREPMTGLILAWARRAHWVSSDLILPSSTSLALLPLGEAPDRSITGTIPRPPMNGLAGEGDLAPLLDG